MIRKVEPLYEIYSGSFSRAAFFFTRKDNQLYVFYDDEDDVSIDGEVLVDKNITRIDFFKKIQKQIRKIECGRYHALFLCNDGSVFALGGNGEGQLGLPGVDKGIRTPQEIEIPSSSKVVDIKAGQESSFFITKNHACFACGSFGLDRDGRISRPTRIFQCKAVMIKGKKIELTEKDFGWLFNQVFPGWEFCFYELANGDLYGAGGVLRRTVGSMNIPAKITFFETMDIELAQIDTCCSAALFLTTKGRVLCVGSSRFDHWFSDGYYRDYSIKNIMRELFGEYKSFEVIEEAELLSCLIKPVVIEQLRDITSIHCGGYHVYFQNRMGQILACGDNDSGELGKLRNHTTQWFMGAIRRT